VSSREAPAPQLIVLGPPGAGKGTQAARLAERLGLVHISPGEVLREEADADSASGREISEIMAAGELVPDEVINRLVRERLEALAHEQGFVLDGYPRTAEEAHALREALSRLGRLGRPVVVWLEVPRETLVPRLRHRREVQGRADDGDDAIARRLATYEAHARAVREALDGWVDEIVVDGGRPADQVTDEILERLERKIRPGRTPPGTGQAVELPRCSTGLTRIP
jgi:adenylate kinase